MCFWGVFRCLEERKNVESSWAEGGNFRKMCLLRSRGRLGLFLSSGKKYEAAALYPQFSLIGLSLTFWKGLDFLILKRCET